MSRRSSIPLLLGFGLLLQFFGAFLAIVYKHFFLEAMPDFVWLLCAGIMIFGFQKLRDARHRKIAWTVAGAGYFLLLCFVVWIFRGAFARP